jgi:hypothetical protein
MNDNQEPDSVVIFPGGPKLSVGDEDKPHLTVSTTPDSGIVEIYLGDNYITMSVEQAIRFTAVLTRVAAVAAGESSTSKGTSSDE